jgi:ATP-dependent exoDNAse (exonuclease V) beta subunit
MITGRKPKTKLELKKEQVEETLRLIYVGITRAKRKLYLSASMKNKNPKNKISPAFETLKELSLKTQGVTR